MTHRNLNAPFEERHRRANVEFAQWRQEHPNFTTPELLENHRRIREAWRVSKSKPTPHRKSA